MDIHTDVGAATAAAYIKCRNDGANDMADLVLALSNELLAFDFTETFTGAFDVGNKVVELLMQRSGINVCCTGDGEESLIDRYAKSKQE